MCTAALNHPVLKQLAVKAHSEDGSTILTHTGGTCITTQLYTTTAACSHLHSLCQQSHMVSSASEAPVKGHHPTAGALPVLLQHQLPGVCKGEIPAAALLWNESQKRFSSIQHPLSENLHCSWKPLSSLQKSRLVQNSCLLTKSRPHFSVAIHWNTRD